MTKLQELQSNNSAQN